MKIKQIAKKDIKKLLEKSAKNWDVYAPLLNKEGDTLFEVLPKDSAQLAQALDSVNLNDEWVAISPKDIFFPQAEEILSFDGDNVKAEVNSTKKLIFGVKPCDAKGIFFADEFFKRDFEDIYYLSRSQDKLVVTIGCSTPPRPDACFCTSTKTGPFAEDGYDLQLVDVGDEYVVEIGSDKGEDFTNTHSDLFKDASGDASSKADKTKADATNNVKLTVDFDKALEIMKSDKDLEENYKRIGERCLYCGGCLYTCPTCTCFNVYDTKKDNKGARRRNWDGCIFKGYTREASGHNPRDEKATRTARRYEHKLKYDYSKTGMSGCTGCGRCLVSCPVEIGMSKFIEEITTNKRKM